MYECLIGFAPFASDSPFETYQKILHWRETLFIPDGIVLQPDTESLLQGLLCEVPDRIPYEHLRVHPFFKGLDWSLLRNFRPPFVPNLVSITDTTYFSPEDVKDVPKALNDTSMIGPNTMDLVRNPKKDLAFVGYTYKRWETLRNDL
jgi:protein-serine/threonine kinase